VYGLHSPGSGTGLIAGSCEQGNEPASSVTVGASFDWWSDY